MLLRFLAEELGVETCDFAAQLFVLLLNDGEAFEGASVHALPVADLLAQVEIITAQGIHRGAQLGELRPQLVKEEVSFAGGMLGVALFEQEGSHDARNVARPAK